MKLFWRGPLASVMALLLRATVVHSGRMSAVAACPDGRVFKDPGAGAYGTAVTFGSLGSGGYKWHGGVLAPSGIIYGIPSDATAVLRIDPTTDSTSTFGRLRAVACEMSL